MKKKIIIGIFSALILLTVIVFTTAAVDSYNYDMDPNNGVDLLEGMGAVFAAVIGGFVVLYELDLFYTVYYFLIKPKTTIRSLLNIFSNFSLILTFAYVHLADIFMEVRAWEYIPIFLLLIYVTLRITCFVTTIFTS